MMATLVRERITVGDVARSHPENSLRILVPQTLVQTRRILVRWSRDPVTLIETLVLPIMFLLTLNIVLGQLISQTTGHSALYGTVPMNALAAAIAEKPPAAVQGTVRAIWESLEVGRQVALDRGLAYTQIGNPIGTAEVDQSSLRGREWRLR